MGAFTKVQDMRLINHSILINKITLGCIGGVWLLLAGTYSSLLIPVVGEWTKALLSMSAIMLTYVVYVQFAKVGYGPSVLVHLCFTTSILAAGFNYFDGYKYTIGLSALHCLLLTLLCIKIRVSTAKKDDPRIYRAILVYPAKSGMSGITGNTHPPIRTIKSSMDGDLGEFLL